MLSQESKKKSKATQENMVTLRPRRPQRRKPMIQLLLAFCGWSLSSLLYYGWDDGSSRSVVVECFSTTATVTTARRTTTPRTATTTTTMKTTTSSTTRVLIFSGRRKNSKFMTSNTKLAAAAAARGSVDVVAAADPGSSTLLLWNDLSQKLLQMQDGERLSTTSSSASASSTSGSSFSPTLDFLQSTIFQPADALLQSLGLGDAALPNFSALAFAGSSMDSLLEQYFAAFRGADFTSSLQSLLSTTSEVPGVAVWLALAVAAPAILTAVAFYALSHPPLDYRNGMEPYPRGQYDYVQAKAYYSRHPLLVARRLAQVLRLSNTFLISYLVDKYIFRKEDDPVVNAKRAQELLTLITQLGPTAIKIGQALSVRPDIINAEYSKALSTLQDQVPPFDSSLAREMLRQELGAERVARLKNINRREPVASASIGQVYKATVLVNNDGGAGTGGNNNNQLQVAVKVQRPNVLAEIALDLYLARELAPLYKKITKSSSDLQALANEWGRGFIVELDYTLEAAATTRFNEEMQKRNAVVFAPRVLPQYSTSKILTTEWVEGTRLDDTISNNAQDIPRLCSVALNAYLVMLLELQSLHCDPHPGNLLRTPDGRLCILDFGMTLDIEPDLQYSLLEYVAHLTAEDYDSLPEDFAKLGFLKPDKLEFARRSGVLDPLKYFLKQIGQGGGAKRLRQRIFDEYRQKYPGKSDDELRLEMRSEMKQRMQDIVEKESVATGITMEVEDLQRQNKDAFQIPEWFLYTSRAFLTLEGVSLQADPDYSLIKSCFPYVARRLVADEDPRARKALKDLLYGAGESLDVKRLTDLADGFSSYTTTTKTLTQQSKALPNGEELVLTSGKKKHSSKSDDRRKRMVEAEAAITLAKDSADILLAPEGNLVQNLLVQESALAASARVKDSLRETLVDGPEKFRQSLPLGVGSFLPPLPLEMIEPFVRKTPAELKAQELAEKLSSLVPQQSNASSLASSMSAARKTNGKELDLDPAAPASVFLDNIRELEPEQAALLLKEIRENVPRYAPMLRRLGGKFVSTLLQTASQNIETTLVELERAGSVPNAPLFRGLSTAAQRGAQAILTNDEDAAAAANGGRGRNKR